MSAPKHTPGPWHWVNSRTDEPFDFDAEWEGEGLPSLRTVAERDKYGLGGRGLPDWILDAEPMQNGNDAANARLIAAAPELLEALEALLSHTADLDPMQGYRPEEDFSAVKQARAAIAKATGEQA